jgi:hypothetical protein
MKTHKHPHKYTATDLDEQMQEVYQALDNDLEQGVHWLTNAAWEKFQTDHPNFIRELDKLAGMIQDTYHASAD